MKNEKTKAIIRLIVMLVLTANMALTVAGKNPIPLDETALTEWLTIAAAGISAVWGWWKNNNVTTAAVEAQKQLIGDKAYRKLNDEAKEELSNGGGFDE